MAVRIQQPSHLDCTWLSTLAYPTSIERFELRLAEAPVGTAVEWFVDERPWSTSLAENGAALWTPERGRHLARARVRVPGKTEPRWTETIAFYVR